MKNRYLLLTEPDTNSYLDHYSKKRGGGGRIIEKNGSPCDEEEWKGRSILDDEL